MHHVSFNLINHTKYHEIIKYKPLPFVFGHSQWDGCGRLDGVIHHLVVPSVYQVPKLRLLGNHGPLSAVLATLLKIEIMHNKFPFNLNFVLLDKFTKYIPSKVKL